jgi:hypothetical protein
MSDDVYPVGLPHDWHPGHARRSTFSLSLPAIVKSRRWSMSEYPYPATLDWARRPNDAQWDEICAWTIKHFGLPGIRYVTEISAERMTWYFETEQDRLLFTLAWGNDNHGF